MSAFVCGLDHFKAISLFAARKAHGSWKVDPRYIKGLDPLGIYADRGLENLTRVELATLYADCLYQENIRSVGYRYPKDTLATMPGEIEKPSSMTVTGRDDCSAKYTLPVVSILKMLDCLEYQSCETENWEQTTAFRLLTAIRRAAIRSLPGYDDAPWDFYAEAA